MFVIHIVSCQDRDQDDQLLFVSCKCRRCCFRLKIVRKEDVEEVTLLWRTHNQSVLSNVHNHLFATLDSWQVDLHPEPLQRGKAWFASHQILRFHLLPTTAHLGLLFSDSGLDRSIVFGFCSGSWSHLLALVTFGWFVLDGLSTVHGLNSSSGPLLYPVCWQNIPHCLFVLQNHPGVSVQP